MVAWTDVRPMLATPHDGAFDDLLTNSRWVFEPKLDGMRMLVLIEPGEVGASVRLWTRNGRDKTAQFPELVKDLKRFARTLRRPVLLDGEVVALDARGQPQSFQRLAGRIHLTGTHAIEAQARRTPVALVAFDVLRDGAEDLRDSTLVQRRARLEKIIGNAGSSLLRLGEQSAGGDGRRWLETAVRERWEGLIAKDAESAYTSGKRSPCWRKLKLPCRQEFVVGGWTEPRGVRARFGSLLAGYYDGEGSRRGLIYAGSVGSGYNGKEIERIWTQLKQRAIDRCPFVVAPDPPERPHWVRPELVMEVKFTEWTDDGYLRHPTYLGMRDDVSAHDVRREGAARTTGRAPAQPAASPVAGGSAAAGPARGGEPDARRATRAAGRGSKSGVRAFELPGDSALDSLISSLQLLEETRRDGILALPDGDRLGVTNLAKVFWSAAGVTKGELLRYYARVSPWLLPAVADRPLVMKRFPNGVKGKAFYQQRAKDEETPAGVRVEYLEEDGEMMPRLVGGSLLTLLYMAQIAAISQDPWFSRVQTPDMADYVALDLDPMPGVPFASVRDVARMLGEELDALGVNACVKTSGSSGLHVYVPLMPGTPYEAGQLFCQIVATLVATRHPKQATVERAVNRRGRTVYIDYLQNIQGKTLATAYSARASEFAGVSTPLAWNELGGDLHPEDFTLRTVFSRFTGVGDLWAPMHGRARVDLRVALEKLAGRLG